MKKFLHAKLWFKVLLMSLLCLSLSGCDNANVYGSVSVGSSWGGYGHPSSRGRVSVGVSGRIR